MKLEDMRNTLDEIYHYQGYGTHPSKCGLKILEKEGNIYVLFTELDDNPGTSVTNSIEMLATQIYNELFKDNNPKDITWMEHYPAYGTYPASLDVVKMDWDGERYISPSWRRIEPFTPIKKTTYRKDD